MMWLTWRQFRTQAWLALGALVVVGAALAVTGPHLAHAYATSGLAACQNAGRGCGPLTDAFLAHYRAFHVLGPALIATPGVIGLFWGAPLLARELEAGTHRLVWTQSITRWRWLAVKLGIVGLTGMVVTGLFSLLLTWWSGPIDRVTMNRFTPAMFAQRGIAPIGYAAFAFALGVTIGLVVRRTLPAMATTVAVFIAVRQVVAYWVRPHLQAPIVVTSALGVGRSTTAAKPGDWIISSRTLDAAGHVIGLNGGFNLTDVNGICSPPKSPIPSPGAIQTCIDKLHVRTVASIQPAGRYWAFQTWETLIFVSLALALAGFCFWWTRRRLA